MGGPPARRYRRHGLAALALRGAPDLIAKAGGGVVESYPHDMSKQPEGKKMSSSFLYNGTRSPRIWRLVQGSTGLCGVVTSQREPGGLHILQEIESHADPQDMTSNDEPIYETVKHEHNWDPERREPLSSTTVSVGRHLG